MTEVLPVVGCIDCGEYWRAGGVARCSVDHHRHRQFEMHRHRSRVGFPDGTEVTAVSFDPSDPYRRDRVPDYGLYLDHRWEPPWPHDHIGWPDFGIPDDARAVVAGLRSVIGRARAGDRVEIGCLGAHGRTGTALSCLAVLIGIPAQDAVEWVRSKYCSKAVETREQEAFVLDTAKLLGDDLGDG